MDGKGLGGGRETWAIDLTCVTYGSEDKEEYKNVLLCVYTMKRLYIALPDAHGGARLWPGTGPIVVWNPLSPGDQQELYDDHAQEQQQCCDGVMFVKRVRLVSVLRFLRVVFEPQADRVELFRTKPFSETKTPSPYTRARITC